MLTGAMRRVGRRHPGLFQRLGAHGNALFALEPTDVPCRFLVWPRGGHGEVRIYARARGPRATATARGPLKALLNTALAARDADADFFSRELSISGDVAALLALRNALEASQLTWRDLIGLGAREAR